MARTETWFDQDLKKPVSVRIMAGVQFSEDNQGSLIGVRVYDDGADATLTGGATGYCILADGQTITVDGTLEGNTAYILLPQSALLVPGPIQITIKLVDDGVITTLLACVGTVIRTKIGVPVVPGSVIEEWSEQISETLQECVDDCQAAADAMGANLAAVYSSSATYPVGSYVIQSGTLYRCTTAVTTAGSWSTNSGKFTAVKLGNDVADLKSALALTSNDLYNFEDTGKVLLTRGEFGLDVYNPNNGNIGTTRPYRISSRAMIAFPYAITLTAASGYKFNRYRKNSSNQWVSAGWETSYSFSANEQFYIQISKFNGDTEITTGTADPVEFVKAISVSGGVVEEVKTDINDLQKIAMDACFSIKDYELGRWKKSGTAIVKNASPSNNQIRSVAGIKASQSLLLKIKKPGITVSFILTDSNDEYIDLRQISTVGDSERDFITLFGANKIYISAQHSDFSVMPVDVGSYFEIIMQNTPYVRNGKQLIITHFGGNGNDWCFVRTPANYDQFRKKPYPFVICNHGNGWTMDGTIGFANWTNRTMYVPENKSDYYDYDSENDSSEKYDTISSILDQVNVTSDSTLWYSNPTIEALLTAGYIVCGCENYGDQLYGNNNCRNACVDFFNYMRKTYNVEDRCYMIGASNGAMTSLNAAYLLQGAVKAMILQYPLTCLAKQYKHGPSSQRPGIRAAYGFEDTISPSTISEDDLAKALATHDPLTVDVVDGIKVGVFPPTKFYYSNSDSTTSPSNNTTPLYELLYASNKVTEKVECTGGHGDKSHFVPDKYVEWFDAN